MKKKAKYDTIAGNYLSFMSGNHVVDLASEALIEQAGPVAGCHLCELACGIGIMASHFARQGAHVIGVDLSDEMLHIARERYPDLHFVRDDAQSLASLDDDAFDVVTSNLALMDIPDLTATYDAVKRVLKPGGRFIFTVTHPCFQSPHSYLVTDDDDYSGRHISHYAQEGFWKSTDSSGIRGQVGAYHRTLSTYINGLLQRGFRVNELIEPTLQGADAHDTAYQKSFTEIPPVLLIDVTLAV
jgi:SAM-dependent methyltransferase